MEWFAFLYTNTSPLNREQTVSLESTTLGLPVVQQTTDTSHPDPARGRGLGVKRLCRRPNRDCNRQRAGRSTQAYLRWPLLEYQTSLLIQLDSCLSTPLRSEEDIAINGVTVYPTKLPQSLETIQLTNTECEKQPSTKQAVVSTSK